MVLKLADVKLGYPKPLQQWDNRTQKRIDLNPREFFLKALSKDIVSDNIPNDAGMYHKNYLGYLSKCWNDHLGVVISPDHIWFTLLNELATIVKENAEKYRYLFSDSKEKQTIIIVTNELVVMPIGELIASLKKLVPENVDEFLPKFSISTERSIHACNATFCDLVSPYYNYCMMMCGIPLIDVRGTLDDWNVLYAAWTNLAKFFPDEQVYFAKVETTIENCINHINDQSWWLNIFSLERCGSGSDVEVCGWFTNLFKEVPSLRYISNYPTGISKVNYKQLNTNIDYEMQNGLFFSMLENDLMVPDFGNIISTRTVSN